MIVFIESIQKTVGEKYHDDLLLSDTLQSHEAMGEKLCDSVNKRQDGECSMSGFHTHIHTI